MNEMDKNERSALLKKLKEKGISPLENSSDKSDYKEVIKNVLEHMNNVGGYSSDQVREDIEAIIHSQLEKAKLGDTDGAKFIVERILGRHQTMDLSLVAIKARIE